MDKHLTKQTTDINKERVIQTSEIKVALYLLAQTTLCGFIAFVLLDDGSLGVRFVAIIVLGIFIFIISSTIMELFGQLPGLVLSSEGIVTQNADRVLGIR